MHYVIILARLVLIEVTILFLLWWQTMSSLIFANTVKLRASDPFELGVWAASRVTFSLLPFIILPFVAVFALPSVSQRASATFLIALFVPIVCIAAFAASVSLIPLLTAGLLAVLIWFLYSSSHSARKD